MNRASLFILPDGAPSTFSRDESLASLPLPRLDETLERYYKCLLPFGSEDELRNSRRIIDEFRSGVGAKLHRMLEEKARREKNWVEKYWEDYAYHSQRLPLLPYSSMVLPLMLQSVGVDESRAGQLKSLARVAYHSVEYWSLIRSERVRPAASADGSVVFSSDQFRRLYNTTRIPGETRDEIHDYFKTRTEGDCPSTVVVVGRGRIFSFDAVRAGELISPQEFLHAFTVIRSRIESEAFRSGIPVLTCDDRTNWHENRKHLKELSKENAELLSVVESSILVFSLDDSEPRDISELSQKASVGDFHSRWNDKSSCIVSFANGKMGCLGEHSCYDGTMSYAPYLLLSLMEEPEPDWESELQLKIVPKELKFEIDDHLRGEMARAEAFVKTIEKSLIVRFEEFTGFGKNGMKEMRVHPDCCVQMALQLAYYKLHGKLAPTYETATTRSYYRGRTETVRSCSIEVKDWLEAMYDSNVGTSERVKLFKAAANSQFKLMSDAKQGKGFDRHLFAMWCIAHENNMPTPALYSDPLYTKSGGGGNFELSTSTLGYFINIGYVAPMIRDGFGIFYTMLEQKVWIVISSFRESDATSSKKFYDSFACAMNEIKDLLETTQNKL